MSKIYDICIVGSGAGAGPIAYELSKAGKTVVILEKGPWIKTEDFTKDEIVSSRRSVYTPNLKDEPQVLEKKNSKGEWIAESNADGGRDFWNGNCVGGSSNFMSGYFHRMKPKDFKLLSTYGEIKGANIVDWPISYEDLEPFYEKVERVVGVSGKVVSHSTLEPRSTKEFPYPPLATNIVSKWIDLACNDLGYLSVDVARSIISKPLNKRNSCVYSNYCGSYGCSSDAKGSSRVALLNDALETGNCTILPYSKVYYLKSNTDNKVEKAFYHDRENNKQEISAKVFVIAAQAIETSRLLLLSKSDNFKNGLANNNGLVGKNLIFSGGGLGSGQFLKQDFSDKDFSALMVGGLFVNRSIQNWYEINDTDFGGKAKGGTVDFLFEHANGIRKAVRQKFDNGRLLYGTELKDKIHSYFTEQRKITFEIFNDWLPTNDCFVSLDKDVEDKWGDKVARIRLGYHEQDIKVGNYLGEKAKLVLEKLGTKNIKLGVSGSAPPNLVAGGCRFGINPQKSVLDKNCRAHDVKNLYITDASFMPTGGSVPYTWTIYANSFRVADKIKEEFN